MWLERNIGIVKNDKIKYVKGAEYLVHSKVGQNIKKLQRWKNSNVLLLYFIITK